MALIVLGGAWLIGIFIGSRVNLPPLFGLFALAPLPLLFFGRKYLKRIIIAALGILLIVSATVYSYGSLYSVDAGKIRYYNDLGSTEIKGTVTADPDLRDKSTRLIISAGAIEVNGQWQNVEGKILVLVPRYPEYRYGDVLQLTGEPQTPQSFGDFDYKGYLSHQGIYTTMSFPTVQVMETGKGFAPLSWIYSLRSHFSQTLARVLPEPQAALAQGILLGIRANIPADLTQDFARSGTSHLLAISGLNIGIMAGILLGVGIWLFGRKRYLYVWLALAGVWFYTVITGWNPPVVRGAIMASVFLAAEALGRQRSGAAALVLAAAVMAGFSPYILGDASFQLSFLAMAGLIFIYPAFRDFGRKVVANRLGEEGSLVSFANLVVDTMSATLASIIAVWPLIAYYFGLFSLVGPLATFLAMWVLPVIIALGTLVGIFGLVYLPIAHFFGWLLWPFLSYMILVVEGLGSPAAASVQVGWINPAFIIGYYIVLATAVWLYGRWQKRRSLSGAAGLMRAGVSFASGLSSKIKWTIAPLAIAAVLVSYTAFTMPGGSDLRVSFLDVGQGDAILIQKGNRQILVDGGPSPQAITAELSKQMPFWDRTIDLLVLTHPHQDHLAGLIEVLRRYDVKQVLYPALDYSSSLYREWVGLIGEKKVKSFYAVAGEQIDLGGGIIIEVLNPLVEPIMGTDSDIDNNSVALMVRDGKVGFLLTGDVHSDAEYQLLRNRADLNSIVLKVAHHGSDTSSTQRFLSVASPQVAVISVGADNTYGLPDESVLNALGERIGITSLYRTDIDGTLNFVTNGQKLWLETGK